MRSITILTAVLALSLGVFASPALAGGWAVTTFDDMPGQFVAGQEIHQGFEQCIRKGAMNNQGDTLAAVGL